MSEIVAKPDASHWVAFAQRVSDGEDPQAVAADLGFGDSRQAAATLLAHPEIRKALVAATEARLLSEAAPLALGVMLEVLNDKTCPASVRGKMAIAVYDRAAKVNDAEDGKGNRLEDMTIGELERFIAKAKAATGIIDVTPS